MIHKTAGWDLDITKLGFAVMCFFIFTLLCWVRKIEVFAATHIFANVMIVITLICVIVEGCNQISLTGSALS